MELSLTGAKVRVNESSRYTGRHNNHYQQQQSRKTHTSLADGADDEEVIFDAVAVVSSVDLAHFVHVRRQRVSF